MRFFLPALLVLKPAAPSAAVIDVGISFGPRGVHEGPRECRRVHVGMSRGSPGQVRIARAPAFRDQTGVRWRREQWPHWGVVGCCRPRAWMKPAVPRRLAHALERG